MSMRKICYRVALPIAFGALAAALMSWDIYNVRVIESMGMAWDTGAPFWPYRTAYFLLFAIYFPSFALAVPVFVLGQLQTYPTRIMMLPLIALWWWVGTWIDFGILGRRRYRHPKITAGILVAVAIGLLFWAIQTAVSEFQFRTKYGLELRANYLFPVTTRLPIVSWWLILSGVALIGAKRVYSNR